MSTYLPTGDFLLLRAVEGNKQIGGILLPESAQPKNHAEIVAMGPGKYQNGVFVAIAGSLNIGDRVIYNRFIEVEKGLYLVREEEILAVIK